jgi:hypothetical protein
MDGNLKRLKRKYKSCRLHGARIIHSDAGRQDSCLNHDVTQSFTSCHIMIKLPL